MVNNNLNSA